MQQTKLSAMMEGKNLTKENIDQMLHMVRSASSPEEKTNVMKHSVFFAGQLPLREKNLVDIPATRRLVGASVLESELDDSVANLLEGLSTQKLLIKGEDGSYTMNTKYEKSLLKVRKIIRAWQLEKDQIPEELLARVKKMYQTGTRYYNSGDYEEAAAAFMNTIEMAEYRMGYYSLALLYMDGKGVDQSYEQALLYARAAIARGARIAEALEEDILARMGKNT
jgi:tetratricopeptide (TPR) repeat protein